MNDVSVTKIWACIVMLVITLISGLLPIKARKWLLNTSLFSEKTAYIALSASLCFGAGILFATTFLHILGEIQESFAQLKEEGKIIDTEYPLPELVICSGFFLIYLLEEVVHSFVNYRQQAKPNHQHHQLKVSSKMVDLKEDFTNGTKLEKGDMNKTFTCGVNETSKEHPESSEVSEETVVSNFDQINHEHVYEEVLSVRSIMVIVALSFHGCFEGFALGLSDTKNDVWMMCLALSIHKVFIGFSIGLELLELGINKSLYFIQIGIFSIASPLGGIVGVILSEHSANSEGSLVISILEGISGGTILYVVFCEILERERVKADGRIVKFLALFLGFGVMALIQIMHSDQGHSHGNEFEESVNATIMRSTHQPFS